MLNRLNLPTLPNPDTLLWLVETLKAVTEYAEGSIPLYNQAKSLSHERGIMLDKLFDVLLEHVHVLAITGALEPIQDLLTDLLSNEVENMELLMEMNAQSINLTVRVREISQ